MGALSKARKLEREGGFQMWFRDFLLDICTYRLMPAVMQDTKPGIFSSFFSMVYLVNSEGSVLSIMLVLGFFVTQKTRLNVQHQEEA